MPIMTEADVATEVEVALQHAERTTQGLKVGAAMRQIHGNHLASIEVRTEDGQEFRLRVERIVR